MTEDDFKYLFVDRKSVYAVIWWGLFVLIAFVTLISVSFYFAQYAQVHHLSWTGYWLSSKHSVVLFIGAISLFLMIIVSVIATIDAMVMKWGKSLVFYLLFLGFVAFLITGFTVKFSHSVTEYKLVAVAEEDYNPIFTKESGWQNSEEEAEQQKPPWVGEAVTYKIKTRKVTKHQPLFGIPQFDPHYHSFDDEQ